MAIEKWLVWQSRVMNYDLLGLPNLAAESGGALRVLCAAVRRCRPRHEVVLPLWLCKPKTKKIEGRGFYTIALTKMMKYNQWKLEVETRKTHGKQRKVVIQPRNDGK